MDGSGIARRPENAVQAFSSTTLKIEDLEGELQFTAIHKSGWLSLVAISGVITVAIAYGVLAQNDSFFLGAAVVAAIALVNWVKGPVTVLRVTESRIRATGNLHRWSDADFALSADKVGSIGWSPGGRYRSEGLHVWHGLMGSTCILPGLSERQAKQVTDAIATHFPHYKIEGISRSLFEFSGRD